MAKKKTESLKNDWEEAIGKMRNEELQRIWVDPETLNPEMLKLAAKQDRKNTEKNAPLTMKVFLKALKKRRLKYELNDHRVVFTYMRNKFLADLDFEENFVIIDFFHNIFIDKDDEAKLNQLRKVCNATNKVCRVNTFYEWEEDDEIDFVYVKSHYTIPFVAQNPNFEMELYMILSNFLSAQHLVKNLM